jgi:hypothetical protein
VVLSDRVVETFDDLHRLLALVPPHEDVHFSVIRGDELLLISVLKVV